MHKIEKSCDAAADQKKSNYRYKEDTSILYPGKKFCMGCPVGEEYKKAWIIGLGKCGKSRAGGMEQQRPPMKIQIKHDKRRRVMWYKNGTRVAGSELSGRVKDFVLRKYKQSRSRSV